MYRRPEIAVVIITYNAQKFFVSCIESILHQTYKPKQIIVCDDASTDETPRLIRQYQRRYPEVMKVFLHSENVGIPKNINSGLSVVSAEYFSLIAGDDIWHETKLEREAEVLARGRSAGVYSACAMIDENGKYLGPFKRKYDGCSGNILFEMLMHEMTFRSPLLKTRIVLDFGRFDESLDIFEDWDFKIKFLSRARVEYSAPTTVYYRQHPAGISKRSDHYKYYKSLKKVYTNNRCLIDSLDPEKRALVTARMENDLLFYFMKSKDIFFSKDALTKAMWFREFFFLSSKKATLFLLRHLKGKVRTFIAGVVKINVISF